VPPLATPLGAKAKTVHFAVVTLLYTTTAYTLKPNTRINLELPTLKDKTKQKLQFACNRV